MIIADRVRFSLRTYYSGRHATAAAQFAQAAKSLEDKWRNRELTDRSKVDAEHSPFVSGSVMASVAMVEATINELFSDAEENPARFSNWPAEDRAALADLWKVIAYDGRGRKAGLGTLKRYDAALVIRRKTTFDRGAEPYQSVQNVITLRNLLVHYVPRWVPGTTLGDKQEHATLDYLEKKYGRLFPPSPLWDGTGQPFWPFKCLGYGCCKWALESVVNFADQFCDRLGINKSVDPVRAQLVLP